MDEGHIISMADGIPILGEGNKTFQISRNLGLEHVKFFCLLDSQPCVVPVNIWVAPALVAFYRHWWRSVPALVAQCVKGLLPR